MHPRWRFACRSSPPPHDLPDADVGWSRCSGCAWARATSVPGMDPVDLHEEIAMNPTPATPASAETPKPMPFAIMRNAHEALRASIRLQGEALESGDTRAFADEWRRLRRGLAVHMAM